MTIDACDACLRRTDLIAALGGVIDVQWRTRRAHAKVLGLPDRELLELVAGAGPRRRYESFDPAGARARIAAVGLGAACRCADAYPAALEELPDPPAVLHVAGDAGVLEPARSAAVVGARRASGYGLEVARGLGRSLSSAGVPVISGMALGVDSAAHTGALEGGTPTVAVLAGSAESPYPSSKRRLHAEILARGCAVSEMPPGFTAFRWSFPARNRIIAGLSALTVVVEAAPRSGSLITADFAAELGRPVAAVPGQVTSRLAAGTNGLLQAGAAMVCDGGDVLDLLYADGAPRPAPRPGPSAPAGPRLTPRLHALLDAVEQGGGSMARLAATPAEAKAAARGLTELELLGLVRRDFGGRYTRTA